MARYFVAKNSVIISEVTKIRIIFDHMNAGQDAL